MTTEYERGRADGLREAAMHVRASQTAMGLPFRVMGIADALDVLATSAPPRDAIGQARSNGGDDA